MRFVVLVLMFPLAGCGLIANPYELPPGIAAVAAAVKEDRKDCDAGERFACADYQARIAYCRDEQSKADPDTYACVGIEPLPPASRPGRQ